MWIIAKKAKDQFCSSSNSIGVNGLKPGILLAGVFESPLEVQVLTSSKTQKSYAEWGWQKGSINSFSWKNLGQSRPWSTVPGRAKLWEGSLGWGLHSYCLWITKGQSGAELPNKCQNGSKFRCSLGYLCLSSEASSLLSIALGCTPKRRGSASFPFWSFLCLLMPREKWGNDCNQGMECKHTCRRGKLQHVVLTCDYWASQLFSITCATSQECSLHSLLNGYPNFTLFKDFRGKKIPDFAAILFSSHISSVFKPIWFEPLFFCPLSTTGIAKRWGIFSASLRFFSAMQMWNTNLFFPHICKNCIWNVIFLLSQQTSRPLQSAPL